MGLVSTFTLFTTLLLFVIFTDCLPCPKNCTCDDSRPATLRIDCGTRLDPDGGLVYRELDSLLASKIDDNLDSVTVAKTFLENIPESVCRMTSLTHLYLNENRLKRLPDRCFANLTRLKIFQASYNQIERLQDGIFNGLQKLREITLDNNRIAVIGQHLFSNVSDLLGLRNIQLHHNHLTSVGPWLLIRGLLGSDGSPVTVNLDVNNISLGINPLNWTFNCGMRLFLNLGIRDNNIAHFTDIMRPFGFKHVEYICLINFKQGPDGTAHAQSHFALDGNPFACDCVDFVLYQEDAVHQYAQIFSNQYCMSPNRLRRLEIPRIPLTEFVCDMADACPAGCQCFYRPVDASMNVNCRSASMMSLPQKLPARPKTYVKYRLAFSNNTFSDALQNRDYLDDTEEFDGSSSGIRKVNLQFWSQIIGVKKVSLRDNKLTSLPRSVANVSISSSEIDLGKNPWNCSCEHKWMTPWLSSIQDKLSAPGDIQCASPERLRGKNMFSVTDDDYCYVEPSDMRPIIIALSTLSGCFVLVLIVCLTVYQLRLLLFIRWKFHPFDRDECEGEEMDYDVFLCCSSEDNEQHGLTILNLLEETNYRVCYHLRDFLGGVQIEENIIASIQRSKRTVCLVNENFMRSAYCMHEFAVAFNHNICIKHDRRLIVLMASKNPETVAPHDAGGNSNMAILSQYLRQYTYIDYMTTDWFTKLRYALPVNGMKDSSQVGDDVRLLL